MIMNTRYLLAAMSIAALGAGCGHKLPGGGGVPTVPSTPSIPGGASGEVDPNTCGNYAAVDAGMKLKAFLQATKDLQTTTLETAKVIKQSCIMMGNELGMSEADLAGDDTNGICAKVITTYQDNLKVSFKPKQALKIKLVAPKCTVDVSVSAGAAAGCGNDGANLQCRAAAVVKAAINAKCTEPSLTLDFKPTDAVDASKLTMTVNAMRNGVPKLLSVGARIKPIDDAVTVWEQSLASIKDMGPTFVQSFKDQAMCISNQINLAAKAATSIKADVHVSVEVSASASTSVGG